MRPTLPGAKSGNRSITTLPLVVSMISAFSRSLISAMSENPLKTERLLAVGGDADLDHAIGVGDGPVLRVIAFLYVIHQFHAADDVADDSVLAVERRRRREHDEELRIGG